MFTEHGELVTVLGGATKPVLCFYLPSIPGHPSLSPRTPGYHRPPSSPLLSGDLTCSFTSANFVEHPRTRQLTMFQTDLSAKWYYGKLLSIHVLIHYHCRYDGWEPYSRLPFERQPYSFEYGDGAAVAASHNRAWMEATALETWDVPWEKVQPCTYIMHSTPYTHTLIHSCSHHIVLTILFSPYCSHHTVLTILYSPYCTHHTVLTILYSPYCTHHTVLAIGGPPHTG
jgi:hypothetical protein